MTTTIPTVRRAYRISVDVAATLAGEPAAELLDSPGAIEHHQALVRRLVARPEVVDCLLRSAAVAVVGPALARLAAAPCHDADDLLRPLVAELDPAARRYFVEELEDGVAALYFDGVTSTVTAVQVSDLGEE